MGCLVKSSLSALSSVEATICPTDLTLDQFSQTFNGGYVLNFVSALSGIQDFKNLNFTNFYLTPNVLLDNITLQHHQIIFYFLNQQILPLFNLTITFIMQNIMDQLPLQKYYQMQAILR